MRSHARRLALLVALAAAACTKAAPAPDPAPAQTTTPESVTRPPAPVETPRVAATVNGVAIPWELFAERMDVIVARRAKARRDLSNEQLREQATRVVIELAWHEMLRQECERLALDYDPEQVTKVEEALFGKPGVKRYGTHRDGPDDTHTDASRRAAAIAELRSRLVIDELARLSVTPERVAEAFEATKAEFTSARGWTRVAEVVFRFPGPGPTTVAACDDLVHRYERCLAAHPDVTDFGETVTIVREDLVERSHREHADVVLTRDCRARSARLADARMLGCDWTASAPGARAVRREHRAALSASARALSRDAKKDPSAFDAALVATTPGDPPPLHDIVSLSTIDPALAKALETLALGEISPPIEAGDGFHVVKVLERWPAGALPFAVRGPAIERELLEQETSLLRMQIRERLDLRYEILTEIDVVDWAKGPGATREELDAKP